MTRKVNITRLCCYGVIAVVWPIAAVSYAIIRLWYELYWYFLQAFGLDFSPGGGSGGGARKKPEGVPTEVGPFSISSL